MYSHYSSSFINLNKCILTFGRFLSHPGVRFFEVDTWVFLLAAFAVFSAFYACTTAKKRFVKLLMYNRSWSRLLPKKAKNRTGPDFQALSMVTTYQMLY